MKTKILIIFGLSLMVFVFSCSKNEIDQQSGKKNSSPESMFKSTGEIDLTGVEVINGIMKFPNKAKVDYLVEALDGQCDDYWTSILNLYGSLNDDDFNDLLDSLGINEDQPIINFEDNFNFYSLRKEIEIGEEAWLELGPDPDCCLDPDDHFIIDETFRALFNAGGEVIVGDDIYKIYYSGTMIKIDHLDFPLLAEINRIDTADFDTIQNPNFSFVYKAGQGSTSQEDDCKRNVSRRDFDANGDYRIKWVIGCRSYPILTSRIISKTKNYKKKKKNWKKYRTECWAQVEGDVYDEYCNFMGNKSTIEHKNKKKKVKAHYSFGSGDPISVQSGDITSYHNGAGGIISNHSITW